MNQYSGEMGHLKTTCQAQAQDAVYFLSGAFLGPAATSLDTVGSATTSSCAGQTADRSVAAVTTFDADDLT